MRWDIRTLGATALLSCLLQPAFGADPTPAAAIATKMASVTDDLNRNETGPPVQAEQKVIVRDLDELIASLEKQCQAAAASSGTTPGAAWPIRRSAPARAGSGPS